MLPTYVKEIAQESEIELEITTHKRATSTCHEKADLLGWAYERVIKALYGIVWDDPVIFVLPETRSREGKGKIIDYRTVKHLFSEADLEVPTLETIDYSDWLSQKGFVDKHYTRRAFTKFQQERKKTWKKEIQDRLHPSFKHSYGTGDLFPKGMEFGTATPFLEEIKHSDLYGEVKAIFVHEQPSLDEQIVDVSIGGKGDIAHRTSLQLPYGAIYTILKQKFPDVVHKTPFWK